MQQPSSSPERFVAFSAKRTLLTVATWALLGLLGGYIAAMFSGEHGSIIFLMMGVAVGTAGALSHATLLLVPLFRRASLIVQAMAAWASCVLGLIMFAAWGAAQSDRPYPLALSEALSIVVLYWSLPALVAAVLAVRLTKNAA